MRVSSEWVRGRREEWGGGKSSEGSGLGHLSIIYTPNTCNCTQTRIQQNSFWSPLSFSKLQDLNHVATFSLPLIKLSEQLDSLKMSRKNLYKIRTWGWADTLQKFCEMRKSYGICLSKTVFRHCICWLSNNSTQWLKHCTDQFHWWVKGVINTCQNYLRNLLIRQNEGWFGFLPPFPPGRVDQTKQD